LKRKSSEADKEGKKAKWEIENDDKHCWMENGQTHRSARTIRIIAFDDAIWPDNSQ